MTSLLCVSALLLGQPGDTPLRFHETKAAHQVIATLPAAQAAKLPAGRLTQEAGEAILTLSLLDDDTKKPGPAMFGKYERNDRELAFTPRFPLEPGQTYRAVLKLDGESLTMDYRIPELKNQTPPKVIKIYPTTNVLPANHLKFYVYFDRPMRGGKEIFNLIQIVDDKGNVIDDAWLLDEIWDEENNCLIIYIHPGRIKWGVMLRELLGPVLFEKREYAFRIRGTMSDRKGNKLGADVVKKFRTTPEDRVRIDLSGWKVTAPSAGTREPLTLTMSKSIDHRSLQRFLTVTDENANVIAGTMAISNEEKTWQFTPTRLWEKRGYHLDVHGELEDVAGNTPLLAFDNDLKAKKLPPQKLRWDFQAR